MNMDDIAEAQAKYKANVIKTHRKNLEEKIDGQMLHGSKSYVEVSQEGEIISVTLVIRGDESRAVRYIVENMGVPRERIKLKYDKN